ncbi:MAG: glycosyltransferase family 2 protein [Desulfovibrio sp.]
MVLFPQDIDRSHLFKQLASIMPQWAMGVDETDTALALARRCFTHTADGPHTPLIQTVGFDLASWTWQKNPLHAEATELLGHIIPKDHSLAPILQSLLAIHKSGSEKLQEEVNQLLSIVQSGETAQIVKQLIPRLANPSEGLFRFVCIYETLLKCSNKDISLAALETVTFPEVLHPLKDMLKAQWSFLHDSQEQTLQQLDCCSEELFPTWLSYLKTETLLRSTSHVPGESECQRGKEQLSALIRRMPWHPTLPLKLAALSDTSIYNGDFSEVCILLYSWNKADLVDATLTSIAESDTGKAKIYFLDNGSTDHMQDVIKKHQKYFGKKLHPVRLPINIGAPAARNWLLSLPEVTKYEYAAFLDDDVILPAYWLKHLMATATNYSANTDQNPPAVTGCRIISATTPDNLQSADYNMYEPQDAPGMITNQPENIRVFDNCAGSIDYGLFNYCRRAVSVSGCCHLLHIPQIAKTGLFDIRFSPTQFDDLERDIRANDHGQTVVYNGTLAIRHIQHSSLVRAKSNAAMGHIFGNKLKLEAKYTKAQLQKIFETNRKSLWKTLFATA